LIIPSCRNTLRSSAVAPIPKPGEISLAQHGVLYLDDYRRPILFRSLSLWRHLQTPLGESERPWGTHEPSSTLGML
jgi:predicted ATPase with chaperone activity